jgi:Fic family protein
LVSEGLLDAPLLYLSAFFERNKDLYYDNLTQVREHDEMQQWLKYFLVGIEQTATNSVNTLTKILQLKDRIESEIRADFGRRYKSAITLATHLFTRPFVTTKQAMNACQLSKKAATDLIDAFVQQQWLEEMTGSSRNRIFAFEPYLALFE